VTVSETSNAFWLGFTTQSGSQRNMMLILDYIERYTNGESVTFFDLGANDEAQTIIKGLVETFGGHYLANDCDDECEWEYIPSNGENIELTEQDILERKLYDKLSDSNLTYNEKNNMIKFIASNLDWVKSL
jgi:hypothetical protein